MDTMQREASLRCMTVTSSSGTDSLHCGSRSGNSNGHFTLTKQTSDRGRFNGVSGG
jgi:hypothetical protein